MSSKIAWLTPWNSRSAIAAYSAHIVAELQRRGNEVTIYRTESESGLAYPSLPFEGPVEPLDALHAPSLGWRFDHIAGNIGDNFQFHAALPRVMDEVPILGIFHDGLIAHLADPWSRSFGDQPDAPLRLARSIYGDSFQDVVGRSSTLEEVVKHRPMLEWLAGAASGCFIHSRHWASRFEKACPGAVTVHPLSMPFEEMPDPPEWRGKVVVATIGHVNRNKRADEVIAAIAGDPVLKACCEYRLLGHVEADEKDRLLALAARLGLEPPIFTGWLEPDRLREQVAEVHVLTCLRYPVFETGSASLILAMQSGRPVLVSEHGAYAEVPSDGVLACDPGNEASDVARHLKILIGDPARAPAIARTAMNFTKTANSVGSYVDALLVAMEKATSVSPKVAMLRTMGKSLGSMQSGPTGLGLDRLAANYKDMFGIEG